MSQVNISLYPALDYSWVPSQDNFQPLGQDSYVKSICTPPIHKQTTELLNQSYEICQIAKFSPFNFSTIRAFFSFSGKKTSLSGKDHLNFISLKNDWDQSIHISDLKPPGKNAYQHRYVATVDYVVKGVDLIIASIYRNKGLNLFIAIFSISSGLTLLAGRIYPQSVGLSGSSMFAIFAGMTFAFAICKWVIDDPVLEQKNIKVIEDQIASLPKITFVPKMI